MDQIDLSGYHIVSPNSAAEGTEISLTFKWSDSNVLKLQKAGIGEKTWVYQQRPEDKTQPQ